MDAIYKKLNGYQRHNKSRHLIAKELGISDPEYRLWGLLGSLCGWDKKYGHLYRKVQITLKELAVILNWDESKASRVINSLIKKGLIERAHRSRYTVKVLAEKGTEGEDKEQIVEIKEKLAQSQKPFAKTQDNLANSQENQGYSTNSPLVSYKSNGPLRTEEEYLQIWRELGYDKEFDVSDMKFVDQMLYEETGMKPN